MDESHSDSQQQRDTRYNYLAASADVVGFPIGNTFVALGTVITAFLSELTRSAAVIGALQSLFWIGNSVPPIFSAYFIERMPKKRTFVFCLAFGQRLGLLGLAIATLLLGNSHPQALIGITFLMLGNYFFLTGINSPAYFSVISKVIPTRRRGGLYGYAGSIGGAIAIGSSVVLHLILKRYGFPYGYAYSFFIGFTILTLAIIPFAFIREPLDHNHRTHPNWLSYWKDLRSVLKVDRNFKRYLISQILLSLAAVGSAFTTLYAIQHFHASKSYIAFYTGVLSGTGVLSSAFWGVMTDRKGNKQVMVWGVALSILSFVVAIFAPNALLFTLVFVIGSFAGYALGISGPNILLEFCTPQEAPRYVALSSALLSPFRALAPIIGGFLAMRTSYQFNFGLAACFTFIGLLVLLGVQEPRHLEVASTQDTTEEKVAE